MWQIGKIRNLFVYFTFQTGQTIQLQGGQQVKEPKIPPENKMEVKSLENFIRVMLLSGHFLLTWLFSGVHPTTGLTSHHNIPFFQCHIKCTNIKNNKGNTRKNQTDPDLVLVLDLGETSWRPLIPNCVTQATEYADKKNYFWWKKRLWPHIMIICVLWNGFYTRTTIFVKLLESGWSFARGRSICMIICNHEKGMKNALLRLFTMR